MQNKKGIQLSQAFSAVLVVVLVAVLVIISLVIFTNLNTSFAGTSSVTTTNETGAYINETGYTLANAGACEFNTPVVTSALNDTDSLTILSGNYTLSSAGVLTNATTTTWNNVSVTYTYLWGDAACEAGENMITQFSTYPALIGLVGTIIFLGLVIGVLVASFVFGGKDEV